MFASGMVRRDCYRILLKPATPGVAPTPQAHHLGTALLGKATTPSATIDTFAFVDRASVVQPAATLPEGWVLLDDATLLSALDRLGDPEPLPLAATRAFEHFLARCARAWSDAEVSTLSIDFLVAFGRELTPRLDAHHRMRSRPLTEEEIRTVCSPPFAMGIDSHVLRRYQPLAALHARDQQQALLVSSAALCYQPDLTSDNAQVPQQPAMPLALTATTAPQQPLYAPAPAPTPVPAPAPAPALFFVQDSASLPVLPAMPALPAAPPAARTPTSTHAQLFTKV